MKTKPIILNNKRVLKINKEYKPVFVVDNYKDQLEDLFLIRNPKYKFIKDYQKDFKSFVKKFLKNKSIEDSGNWIYYPWNKTLLHCLNENYLIETKSARNVYLITREEQKTFYNSTIGIAGLSVGSHAALTIAMSCGAKNMKLADNDVISLSNLNRLRYPLTSIGKNKAVFCAEQIYEMNPYANIMVYQNGITEENIEEFLLKPKIDVLIEEMDNLYLKIRIREIAKKHRIPVIMATDHDDNILVDIERYDLNPNYPILHGLLEGLTSKDFKNFEPKDLVKLTSKIAGANFATPRMLKSLLEVGKTIYSWPQLGSAATLCGVALTYLTKKIVLKEKIKSGRILININEILGVIPKNFNKEREKYLKEFKGL